MGVGGRGAECKLRGKGGVCGGGVYVGWATLGVRGGGVRGLGGGVGGGLLAGVNV